MQLKNTSNNQILTTDLRNKDNLIQKSIGLIGKTTINPIYFQTRWGIHTFGVKQPLTILICQKTNTTYTVRSIKSPLHPSRLLFYPPVHNHIFELPYQKYPVKIGDELVITE